MIITLCGSTRFEHLFHAWNEALTLTGNTVFSLAVYPSTKGGEKGWYDAKTKRLLDAAHFRKIDASEGIVVINAFAYVGKSTINEVKYARQRGKKVFFVESWGKGFGVGHTHTDEYQALAKRYGAFDKGSPLDTRTGVDGNVDIWMSDLLGPTGPLRSKVVDLIQKESLR